MDDQIYSEFRENFERLRVDVLDPEELKSEAAKEVRILSLKYCLASDQQLLIWEYIFIHLDLLWFVLKKMHKESGLLCSYNQLISQLLNECFPGLWVFYVH